jgi:hypothetical protein
MKPILFTLIAFLLMNPSAKAYSVFLDQVISCSANQSNLDTALLTLEQKAKERCAGEYDPEYCEITNRDFFSLVDVVEGRHEIDDDQIYQAVGQLSALNRQDITDRVRQARTQIIRIQGEKSIELNAIEKIIALRNRFLLKFHSQPIIPYLSRVRLAEDEDLWETVNRESATFANRFGCFIDVKAQIKPHFKSAIDRQN